MTRSLAASAFVLFALLIPPPASASPLRVSRELPLSAPVLRSASGEQSLPVVAAGRGGFFTAWTDRRVGDGVNGDVYGSRLDREGRPLDAANIPIIPTWLEDTDAAVTWNGRNYVVIYATVYGYLGLTAVEIDVDGRIVQARAFLRPRGGTTRPAIAWNGSEYLVAWRQANDTGTHAEVHAFRLGASLERASEEFAIDAEGAPAIASDGDGFLVATGASPRATLTPVSREGVRGATTEIAATGDLDVDWDGREYLVTRTNLGIEVSRVARDGSVLATRSVQDRMTVSEKRVTAVWTGDRLVLAWADYESSQAGFPRHELFLQSIDAELRTLEGPLVAFAGDGFRLHPSLAYGEGVAAMAWDEWDGANHQIESMTFDPRVLSQAGSRAHELVSHSLTAQQPLGVAASGDTWGAIWLEGVADDARTLRFGRVSSAGVLLDGPGVDLGEYDGASIAANGDMFVIAAYRLGWLYAIRIARDGSLLDPVPIRFGPAATQLRIAAGPGGSFAVVWASLTTIPRPNYGRYDAYATVIDRSGQLLASRQVSPPVSEDTSYTPLDVAWSGQEFHVLAARSVVSQCSTRICPSTTTLTVIRVSAGGTPLGTPVDVAVAPTSTARIASNGNGTAVVWDSYIDNVIRLKRLARDGWPVDGAIPGPPTVVATGSMRPEITFDGFRYVIAFGKGAGALTDGVGFTTLDPETGVIGEEQVLAEAQAPMQLSGGVGGRTLMVHAKKYVPTPEAHPGSILRGAMHILGVTGEPRMRAVR